jgi:hypothetical protein
MLDVRQARAHPRLRGVVLGYRQRLGDIGSSDRPKLLLARPTQFLELYLGDPYRVRPVGARFNAAPQSVVVAPTTATTHELVYAGFVDTFTILFQPTGMARLFGADMSVVGGHGEAAELLPRALLRDLEENLRSAGGFRARVAAANQWLDRRLDQARAPDPIDAIAFALARSNGALSVAAAADRAGLSARHLQRRFVRDVGLTPKLYARLSRFSAAMTACTTAPTRNLADVAAAFGFADQAHFAREARFFAGRPPSALTKSPNALIGAPDVLESDSSKPAVLEAR